MAALRELEMFGVALVCMGMEAVFDTELEWTFG